MQIYSKKDILEVAKILKNGGIIAFPTETVFGLGVLSNSKENFLKLVKVKNRNPDKPFTLMISKIEQVKDLVEIDAKTAKIIKKFMPGPLTLVLKKKNNSEIPSYFDLNSGYIGIRIPDDKFILSLIDLVDCPLLVPSANNNNNQKNYLKELLGITGVDNIAMFKSFGEQSVASESESESDTGKPISLSGIWTLVYNFNRFESMGSKSISNTVSNLTLITKVKETLNWKRVLYNMLGEKLFSEN